VAVSRLDLQGNSADLWLTELARGASTRFTFGGTQFAPLWSPDGSRVVFTSQRDNRSTIFQKVANGAGKEEPLLSAASIAVADDWSRDGRFLLYEQPDRTTKSDLWVLPDPGKQPGSGERKPTLFLGTDFNESQGRFSPDTKWIAYTSDQNGKPEIYVRPFPTPPGGGGQWQISRGGGSHARWRRDGKELFYLSLNNRLMAVDVNASAAALQPGIPKALFEAPPVLVGPDFPTWDVSPDGQRFLVTTAASASDTAPLTVVLNWPQLLKK